ncbi:MAG: class I SAM-dependent methyltransferase [Kofleriaceae bacterium]
MSDGWQTFFDADYVQLWSSFRKDDHTEREADGLWQVLGLSTGSRVLDAPCGYGRISRALASRGASVLGVDQSAPLLEEAERRRSGVSADTLRYARHDLRTPVAETGFDAALNIFSSLGYATEQDDLAILRTLRAAVKPAGLVFVDTMHRDAVAANLSRGAKPGHRLPDGTLVIEEPTLDPVTSRISTCWYWSGPAGSGAKPLSVRIYTITELLRLAESAGLTMVSLHQGCSPDPFKAEGPMMGGRVGMLLRA